MKRAITFLFLTASAGLCAVEETPIDPSDDFSPMMLAITLILLAVVLIIFAIGIVLAIIIAVCCLILVSLGIVSTAALTGILRQKFSSGLRALHYQLCAAVALPAGIVAFWLGVWLFSSDIPLPAILIIGSAAGICAGLVVAFVLDHAVGLAYRHFKRPPTESTTAIEP